MRLTFALLLLALPIAAQPANSAVVMSPNSQANTAGATLTVSVTAPFVLGPLVVTGPGTLSGTYAWSLGFITCGPGGFPPCIIGGGNLNFAASVSGAPGQPFAVLYSTTPAVPMPLPFGPYLMSNFVTPFGRWHTPFTPITLATGAAGVLVDGIGLGLNPAGPGTLPPFGAVTFNGQIPLAQGANSGSPDFAVQALVADPTSASGFSFSAAMTTAHHQ